MAFQGFSRGYRDVPEGFNAVTWLSREFNGYGGFKGFSGEFRGNSGELPPIQWHPKSFKGDPLDFSDSRGVTCCFKGVPGVLKEF